MSLVVVIKDNNRIIFGADKQLSIADICFHEAIKIWAQPTCPGLFTGVVGSLRIAQLLQYSDIITADIIDKTSDSLALDLIIMRLIPNLRMLLRNNGFLEEQSNTLQFSFIIAYKDRAFLIRSDFGIVEVNDYIAIGSSANIANGILYISADKDPFSRIALSIAAVSKYSAYVDNKIDFLVTKSIDTDNSQIINALNVLKTFGD